MRAIHEIALNFLEQPFPLWNSELTDALANSKLKTLFGNAEEGNRRYSLSGCLLKDWEYSRLENILPITKCGKTFSLVTPTPYLNFFYEQHGLVLLTPDEIKTINAVDKLEQTMALFCELPAVLKFINLIVKSLQLIQAKDTEIDMSYSHPDIPFSIFISICESDSMISNLRLAESILHESMHLLLTLVEDVVPLIDADSKAVYYSPWRDEQRPVRGVLHGLFVFKAISDLYTLLAPKIIDETSQKYILKRQNQISSELYLLKNFHRSPGLTENGQKLVIKLVQ